jgi:N utilization substance protein B
MNKVSFKSRKKARRLAMQALYSWLISGNTLKDTEHYFLTEQASPDLDSEYFTDLLYQIPMHLQTLESSFAPHLSRKLEELDPIETTILRIATYELLKRPDIPYRVIINEALELAKSFGATDSYKFINGVLDKMAKIARPTGL